MRGYQFVAVTAVLVVVSWAAPVGSAEPGDLEAAFRAWDTNSDGRLTAEEWRGKAPFARADRNSDGVVTLEEVLGKPAKPVDSGPPKVSTQSQADEMWSRMLAGWDTDKDGVLSAAEWRGRKPHASFDSDGDGLVAHHEFRSTAGETEAAGPAWERALEGWDVDHDGQLTASEWKGNLPFARLDNDGDGKLTEAEFSAALTSADTGTVASQPALQGEPPCGPSDEFQMLLQAMDTDRDGRVSREEWNGGISDWQQLDANGDGYITSSEL